MAKRPKELEDVRDMAKKKQVLALLETMEVFQKIISRPASKISEITAGNEGPLAGTDLMAILETE